MKLKQKMVMLVAILGLVASLSGAFSPQVAYGQTPEDFDADPTAVEADTEAEDQQNVDKCEGEDCCGGESGVKTSIITDDNICNETGEGGVIFGLLKWVLRIMTAGVGIAAVGGIAYGALLYTTAESKPEQTKKAIGIITNVVIGLVAYAFMAVFLDFLIPGGIFE